MTVFASRSIKTNKKCHNTRVYKNYKTCFKQYISTKIVYLLSIQRRKVSPPLQNAFIKNIGFNHQIHVYTTFMSHRRR